MLITGRFSLPPSDGVATEGAKRGGDTEMEDAEVEKVKEGPWKGGMLVSAEEMAALEAEADKADALKVAAGKELIKTLELPDNDRDVLNYQVTRQLCSRPDRGKRSSEQT